MLSKDRRIDKHLFREVFSRGNTISGGRLYAKTLPLPGESRFSFSVPTSVAKKAVTRSTLKRKGYKCLDSVNKDLPRGVAVIFFLKKGAETILEGELCSDIKEIIEKINQ